MGWKKVVRKRKEPLEAELLHQLMLAVINAGRNDIIKGLPEVNEFYGCNIPTVADIVGEIPETAIITGNIRLDDKVYSFQCARLIRR